MNKGKEIKDLKMALTWCIDTLAIVQLVLKSDTKRYGFSLEDSDELLWAKSLIKENGDETKESKKANKKAN